MLTNKGFIKKSASNAYFFNNFLFLITTVQQQFDVKITPILYFKIKTPLFIEELQ